jgi:hypothetical protein
MVRKERLMKNWILFFILFLNAAIIIDINYASEPIIADHNVINEFEQIPEYWINEVKKMMLNIPGASHGTGYMYGLELLENLDSKYVVNITWSGEPESYTATHLRAVRTYRNNYNKWSESGGEEDFYTSPSAINMMKNHINYLRNTQNNPVSVFMFGWCWDMTWHNDPGGELDPVHYVHWAGSSVGGPQGDLRWGLDKEDSLLTGNSVSLQTYINSIEEYQTSDPLTFTVFSTGPADNYTANENGYQRYLKHNYIKEYILSHPNSVLFDYADILSYNDSGEQYINQTGWTDFNGTHHVYPTIHPDNKGNYDGGHGGCHINETGCIRLGKAMWWMLARLAGWMAATNNPPDIDDIPDQSIFEGSSFIPINLDEYVTDPEQKDNELLWTSSQTTNLTVTIIDRVASISITNPEWNGSETVTFTVTDAEGLTDQDDVKFTVQALNDPPIISDIPDHIIAEGNDFIPIILDDYVYDPDNLDNELIWTVSPTTNLAVTINNRVAYAEINDPEWYGNETVSFSVMDPDGLIQSDDVTFFVTAINDPPIVSDIPNQSIADTDTFSMILLDNYVSDPDNADDELTWTVSNTSNLTLNIIDRIAYISLNIPAWEGSESVIFTATDPFHLSDSDQVTFEHRITSIDPQDPDFLPKATMLLSPYPNPFNSTTTLRYYLSCESHVRVDIYSLSGQLILNLKNNIEASGLKFIKWNGKDTDNQIIGSGIYFFQLSAISHNSKTYIRTKKIILMK